MTNTPTDSVPDYTDPQPTWRTGENSRAAIWLRAHALETPAGIVVGTDEEPF